MMGDAVILIDSVLPILLLMTNLTGQRFEETFWADERGLPRNGDNVFTAGADYKERSRVGDIFQS